MKLYKQVRLEHKHELGLSLLYTWLPSAGLTLGTKIGDFSITAIYAIQRKACEKCNARMFMDVIRCACGEAIK